MKYIISVLILAFLANVSLATDKIFVYPHAQEVIVKQKTVEFDADTYLGLQGYYSVIDKLKAEKLAKEEISAETLNKLLDLVKVLLERTGGGTNLPVPTPQTPAPKPEPKPTPTLDTDVFAIFNRDCKRCHNDSNQEGNLKLVGTDTEGDYLYDLTLAKRVKVFDHVNGVGLTERGLKRMPLNAAPLADKDVETLRLWMIDKANKEDK